MITKIKIRGYRALKNLTLLPNKKLNIIVGENEAGKSTLFEAIVLALTGRINGRTAQEELNPYWFNQEEVKAFFASRSSGGRVAPPTISIELFFQETLELKKRFFGAHNSDVPTNACCGVTFEVVPDEQYSAEFESYMSMEGAAPIIPVEYYKIDWRTFGNLTLTKKPKEVTPAVIDSNTIRSTSGVDYHLRQILSDFVEPGEKAAVSLAFRSVKAKMTTDHLGPVNAKMKKLAGTFDGKALSLAMDQTSRSSGDTSISPHISELPFSMAGQGQQAAVKIALVVAREAESAHVVMVEEPENHQSHTRLNQVISQITDLAGEDQQVFVTTHSSFVLNRLGLDSLLLLSNGSPRRFSELNKDTATYFQKLPGYDTLRMVLADRVVLVEGPSDEILFERFYKDKHGNSPAQSGVDVISMHGLTTRRCLELMQALEKPCAVLTDNDGKEPNEILEDLGDLISPERKVFIGEKILGATLEPQLVSANTEATLRSILKIRKDATLATWMKNNKTEGALKIAESDASITAPEYFTKAIGFIDGFE